MKQLDILKKNIFQNKSFKYLCISGILFLGFLIFTILLLFIDVKSIGPNSSVVGYSSWNSWFKEFVGYNKTLDSISKYLGYLFFGIVIFYTVFRMFIEIKNKKNIKKIDKNIYFLFGIDLFLSLIYLFFEFVIINYRPILIDGKLDASYPSTHVLLSLTLSLTVFSSLENNNNNRILFFKFSLIVLGIIISELRTLSGVHWLSDILGAVILSFTIWNIYLFLINLKNKETI